MIDQSNSIKKESYPHPLEKSSNNIIPNLSIIKPENETETTPKNKLLNLAESYTNKNNQNFTFKIIKRRAPWNKKEDEAIIELVNKYGISNWTIIANEMGNMFKSKHRNGKQCRERWHNHLDPIVNKDNWTENEETILFNKHMEYGNKWSDIAKFLPGRTDNSIKNHFYSKLRKFIRKILKQINKENLLKNNGIDCYKYNSDKVYKLLKEYKINYKNVTKDTILELIISIEKNQKGKIFNLSEKKSTINNNDKNNLNFSKNSPNFKNNSLNNVEDNKILIENKFVNKSSSNKKNKSKIKNDDENNEINNNTSSFSCKKRSKKIFKSKLIKIKDDEKENINKNKINENENNSTIKKIKNKTIKKNQQIENTNSIINNDNVKKKLTINPEYINETYNKNKTKSSKKVKIKEKEKNKNKNNDKTKLLTKKRRRKKKRKVSISLSTPESKKTRINRIMPKQRFVFGFMQKMQKNNNKRIKNNNQEVFPEDFDPSVNFVETIREGLEIHSKKNIVINKNLLTEDLFPKNTYTFHPNLNISIPLSPKAQQFPSSLMKSMTMGEDNIISKFNDRNITIGPPTPMNGFFEPQISPLALNNMIMFPPNSTKNTYNVDLGYENNFLRKNFPTPYTPKGFINHNTILTPTTPNREINLANKIIVQNNNNIVAEKGIKKPEPLNLQYIDNYNTDNLSFFPGNENSNLNSTINKMNPVDIFNLSPTSPFIPRPFGEKHL
jgi:hypothetical protein